MTDTYLELRAVLHPEGPDDPALFAKVSLVLVVGFIVFNRLIEDIYVLPIGISLQFSDVILGLLLASWFLWMVTAARPFPRGTAGLLGVALLVLVLVAPFLNAPYMTAFEADGAERGLVRAVLYAGLFVAVYQLSSWRKWAYVIVGTTIAMTVVQALIAVFERMTGRRMRLLGSLWQAIGLEVDPRGNEVEELLVQARLTGELRAQATAPHPLVLSGLLVVGIGLTVALYLHSSSKIARRGYLAVIVVLLVGLASTNQRTGFVALVVVAIVLAVTQLHHLPRAMPLIAAATLGAVGMVLVSPNTPRLILNFFTGDATDHNVTVRTSKYEVLPDLLGERPLIGPGFTTSDPSRVIFDNAYLTELVELGILGLALLLAFLLVVSGRSAGVLRTAPKPDQALVLGATCAAATLFVTMATFDVLSFDQLFPTALILLAVGLARADAFHRASAALAPARQTPLRSRSTADDS